MEVSSESSSRRRVGETGQVTCNFPTRSTRPMPRSFMFRFFTNRKTCPTAMETTDIHLQGNPAECHQDAHSSPQSKLKLAHMAVGIFLARSTVHLTCTFCLQETRAQGKYPRSGGRLIRISTLSTRRRKRRSPDTISQIFDHLRVVTRTFTCAFLVGRYCDKQKTSLDLCSPESNEATRGCRQRIPPFLLHATYNSLSPLMYRQECSLNEHGGR